MKKEVSKVKELSFKDYPFDYTKPVLIVEMTDNDEDAIADLEIVDWSNKLLETIKANPEKEHKVSIANLLPIYRLCYFVKINELSNVILEANGTQYDFVLQNGKMDMSIVPKDLLVDRTQILLTKLL